MTATQLIAHPRARRAWSVVGSYGGALLIAVIVFGPLYWMLMTAIKPRAEVFTSPPRWFPENPTLENFITAMDPEFLRFLGNSLLVSLMTTLVCILLAVLASYTISRPSGKSGKSVIVVVLVSQLLPPAVLLVPLYSSAQSLGLLNSYAGLVIAYLTFTLPVAIWLLHGFISSIPAELEESARVDGMTPFRAFFAVIIPLARPGIAATAAYIFFTTWQDFMFALVFLTDADKRTLPLGLLGYIGQYTVDWGQLMAASTMLLIPILVIFGLVQKQFIAGLTAGAVKG
jgi:ABC-type glycerol-3-phosphate transport system permease component